MQKIKTSNYEFALNFFGINKVPLEKLKAHFVMLSKEIFPGTLEVSVENQKELLKNKGFEIPNLVDTVVSLLLHNITTDFRYFNEEHETIFIHVKEDGRFNCPIIVGRNSGHKLSISFDSFSSMPALNVGAAASLKSPKFESTKLKI